MLDVDEAWSIKYDYDVKDTDLNGSEIENVFYFDSDQTYMASAISVVGILLPA